jgi:hypothetical protein
MTFSVLMYALMVSSLTALVVTLVVDAVRGGSRERTARRIAGPTLRHGRGRAHHRGDCPQTRRSAPSTAVRVRRGGTPSSCRR